MKFDYEEFYNEASVGFFTTNSSGTIINANPFFLSLIQCSAEEVIGKMSFQEFLPIGAKIYYQTHYLPLLQIDGGVKEINFEILGKDKSKIPVLVNSQKKTKDGSAQLIHSVVFHIAQRGLFEKELIAERKHAETLTEKLKATNQKIVAQAETINKQNISLDALNAIKDKFFNIVAHDIKAPLNNLLSFVYILQEPIENNDLKGLKPIVEQVGKSILDTVELVDNLLHWAQSQMMEYGISLSNFILEDLIIEIIQNFRTTAQRKNITITHQVLGIHLVNADKNHLNFIIGNLLSNAIKFTPNNGIISVNAHENELGELAISVNDTGVGMNKEVLDKLFVKDIKITKVGTAGEKGNGIGLKLVKEFVEMNNGTIEVSSEVDKGTTFLVTLKSEN